MKFLPSKLIFLAFFVGLVFGAFSQTKILTLFASEQPNTIWQYQCIDTMKASRDDARMMMQDSNSNAKIRSIISAVKGMGANCVAIDTPYDDEFFPYLSQWVKTAREAHLHVWFRGNFSSWEGWFGYTQNTDPQDELNKTRSFIYSHPDLFADGDIFTPAPEAENGWQSTGSSVANNPDFRQFLINEVNYSREAFSGIGKKVTVNWLSMSGGVAKSVLDQPTVDALGKTVTLDHYVAAPEDMASYIDLFHNEFHANLVLGEFGAPIPDINGDMTEEQQAAFVDSLLHELYVKRDIVTAINYWVINESSTRLLNDDGSPRKVVDVIKKYYIPAIISGRVTDAMGNGISDVSVRTGDNLSSAKTDRNGFYRLIVPAEDVILDFESPQYQTVARKISIVEGGNFTQDVIMEPYTKDAWYDLRLYLKNVWEKWSKILTAK